MNRNEHLLVILAEECAEIAKETSKAIRFGMDEVMPGQALNNRQRILRELNDLWAVVEMLKLQVVDREAIEHKKTKAPTARSCLGARPLALHRFRHPFREPRPRYRFSTARALALAFPRLAEMNLFAYAAIVLAVIGIVVLIVWFNRDPWEDVE